MTYSPVAYAESLQIGIVHFVAPDEIKVLLDIEAPNTTALNTGTARPFPRINGYVLIPADNGHLVAQIEWITIEHSQYPKRKGMQDFGLVDLPYPLRKMSLNPLGRLSNYGNTTDGKEYEFKRGVEAFPTVGDPVLLPTQDQLKAIVESGKNRQVKIGASPLAANAEVKIDPDRLFGRHLAVLGNTGSGKSCSVAGLIRWSLEAAKSESEKDPNARFIILDPNGEYANTFEDMGKIRVFAVEPQKGMQQLQVPLWFWNSAEWSAFTQASGKTQRPTLIQALRTLRDGATEAAATPSQEMRRYLRTLSTALRIDSNSGTPWKGTGQAKGFKKKLIKWKECIVTDASFKKQEIDSLESLNNYIDTLLANHPGEWPDVFNKKEVDALLLKFSEAHSIFGGSDAVLVQRK